MKWPHDGSSPSAARRSDEDDAAAALLIAQLEVRRHEDALAAARRAVVDAEGACALAAAGTPSTGPRTAPSPSNDADAEATVFIIRPPASSTQGRRQTWVYTAHPGVDDAERLGNFCGLLGSALRPLLVLRREPPDPMPVAHVATLATYAASHETPLNRLMSGLAIGQVRADVGAGSAAGSGQVRVGAAWAQRGVLAAQVAADVISTAARTCMSFATQQLVGTLSLDSDLPSTCKRVSVRSIEADALWAEHRIERRIDPKRVVVSKYRLCFPDFFHHL
ncbi:hypothetical protein M885DRAFT_517939, partial [Pelagophyceae sp. CCMP2097]